MTLKVDSFDQYVCTFALALLPGVQEATFETRMLQEIIPNTMVSRRTIRRLELEHLLLKDHDIQRAGKYQWQIQILAF